MGRPSYAVCLFAARSVFAVPAEPNWFEQLVDHFAPSIDTFKQRYYKDERFFGGPGSPIFVILGGEGSIPPETGIFYPWITDVLAREYKALVIEPEHRFYGESLPFGREASFTNQNLQLMSSQQALADTAHFIRAQQAARNCTERGTSNYCPVLTIGGSYPGFLSAMMRLRYPSVVDMAYAASAPMKFYAQDVDQYSYYDRITRSAERSLPGCASAVRQAFDQLLTFFGKASIEEASDKLMLCQPGSNVSWDRERLFDDILFLAEQTFANLNMANYPPDNTTGLYKTCINFMEASRSGKSALLQAMTELLLTQTQTSQIRHSGRSVVKDSETRKTCFDVDAQLPAGQAATARCGDWSGCGVGRDGQMWDYQTCTFEVEHIGFGGKLQMFPERPWSESWLKKHCWERFGVDPQPRALVDLWGFDFTSLRGQGASRIVFTNGLNDGWSVGGFQADPSTEQDLLVINLPNGAHHSDLSHNWGDTDTPDVQAAHAKVVDLVGKWLQEVRDIESRSGNISGTFIAYV
eukprot:TRINITY_DN2254_c0_g1_i1.p1 TRINITY_DN2254_c0_g1~~TRINITY_DN2254_c0_g1_i1.p1  ORF type:complete len:533 (-),score=65.22 TRINITY_DN2254_c0_g1_i1:125-1690(-)